MVAIFKNLLFISLIAFAVSCGEDKQNKEVYSDPFQLKMTYAQCELNCPVKSLKLKEYDASAKFGEAFAEDLKRVMHMEFNIKGQCESIKNYDRWGDISEVGIIKYDSNDNIISIETYSSDGDLIRKIIEEYDPNGRIMGQSIYDSDGNRISSTEIEHENGKILKEKQFVRDDCEAEKLYEYDGCALRKVLTYHKGELQYVKVYEKCDYTGDVEYIKYDGDGNVIEELQTKYDANRVRVYEKGVHIDETERIEYEYRTNSYGFVEYVNNGRFEEFYEYEYDNKGNWIKQICYEGAIKKPVRIVEREIVYW